MYKQPRQKNVIDNVGKDASPDPGDVIVKHYFAHAQEKELLTRLSINWGLVVPTSRLSGIGSKRSRASYED